MTRKELRSLILKRLDELDRLCADEYPDPVKIAAKEARVVYEIADKMARAGFHGQHSSGYGLRPKENPEAVKTYLSRCLRALRPKRRAGAASTGTEPEMLSPPEVAQRYGVSPDTVRRWIAAGQLPAVNVGQGQRRPRYRVSAEGLKEFDAKRPARVAPEAPRQRRRRRKVDLPFTRYTSRPKASPERGP